MDSGINYLGNFDPSYSSAKKIIPYVLTYLPNIKSVIDTGCALGSWLLPFIDSGIEDVIGKDIDEVNIDDLKIPKNKFVNDLNLINRKFDLVISLETAEHIEQDKADDYIKDLVSLGDVILFSAAVPRQGGANHVNERWLWYWKNKFKEHGFVGVDCLRSKIFRDVDICWWYRQNILFWVREDKLKDYPKLEVEEKKTMLEELQIVHKSIIDRMEKAK